MGEHVVDAGRAVEDGGRAGVGTDPGPRAAPERGRSARKRQAILDAACTVFLRDGYGGTSMDNIAALARVSKQTVYKHFADKQRLFTAVIDGVIDAAESDGQEMLDGLLTSGDLGEQLRHYARRHLAVIMQPHIVQMRRVIIGAADQFPELARSWYERAPARGRAAFAALFSELARQGRLRVSDPELAAEHFNWLILSIPLNRAMFRVDDEPPAVAELDYYADEGVRVFLAAYAPALSR
ncbi:TetR/AcrR family transcriptional regulator [Phytoactinopolyspora limicola]|uniref:TetR/AcrR family transcriptional regulator n=1 Tax=Phytoactinopolyspora limicola TaxID=2715536 RepID=UPI00140948D8|nr:TetR/AcrR family transcriptional regulator [Phytoactinopolyspora limicola]